MREPAALRRFGILLPQLQLALNLERDSVGAVVMGPYADLKEGMKVTGTAQLLAFLPTKKSP